MAVKPDFNVGFNLIPTTDFGNDTIVWLGEKFILGATLF